MDPVSLFANFPGLRIVAPSTPQDYVAAMNAALALEGPVAVLEHTVLYQTQGEVRDAQIDAYLPLRSVRMVSTGERATVISYPATTPLVGSVVAEQGLDVDHIDLRWLDAASVDWETIGASVDKTNRVFIADMGAAANSYGEWLSHEIQSRFFDHLDTRCNGSPGGRPRPRSPSLSSAPPPRPPTWLPPRCGRCSSCPMPTERTCADALRDQDAADIVPRPMSPTQCCSSAALEARK